MGFWFCFFHFNFPSLPHFLQDWEARGSDTFLKITGLLSGPVIKILCFYCRERGFDPACICMAKKRTNKTKKPYLCCGSSCAYAPLADVVSSRLHVLLSSEQQTWSSRARCPCLAADMMSEGLSGETLQASDPSFARIRNKKHLLLSDGLLLWT